MRVFVLFPVLLIGWPLAASAEPFAVPADGPPFQAELTAIDEQWNIVFTAETGRQVLAAADLVRWGAPREFLRGPVIVLAGGGLLAAEVTGIDKLDLAADSPLWGPITIPLDQVAGVVFQLPADLRRQTLLFDRASVAVTRRMPSASVAGTRRVPSAGEQNGSGPFSRNGPEGASQKNLLSAVSSADRIVLENGDELTGLLDRLDLDGVRLRTDAGPLEADRRNVTMVIFNPALAKPARPEGLHAWVGLRDGSLLPAARVVCDARKLTITDPAGQIRLALPADLVFLQPMGGRTVYLSAVEPDSYHHTPYLELQRTYHIDRSVTGGRLRCAGHTYLTGLGMHTSATLTYRLDGDYHRFQSEVGVDDSTGGRGSVHFRVFVDGREQFTSGPVRGGEPPQDVDLDINGADRLDLVVDFAERAHVLDHANWLDARLVKPADR